MCVCVHKVYRLELVENLQINLQTHFVFPVHFCCLLIGMYVLTLALTLDRLGDLVHLKKAWRLGEYILLKQVSRKKWHLTLPQALSNQTKWH